MTIRRLLGVPGRRGIALAAAVLVLGLATGGGAAVALTAAERTAADTELRLRTAAVRAALDTTFQRYADTLHDLVAVAATQPMSALGPTVERLVDQRLPGAHDVLLVAADGSVATRQTADGSTPAAVADPRAEPELLRTMQLARTSGRLVASPAYVLPDDRELPPAYRQLAFALAAPVHGGESGFRGWVLANVRAGDLLATSLRGATVNGVAVTLAEVAADGATHDVAGWSTGGTAHGVRAEIVDVALAGHAWQAAVRPTTALVGVGRTAVHTVVITAALSFGLVLALVVLALSARRHQALASATRAAAQTRTAADRADRAEAALRERDGELAGFAAVVGDKLQAPLHNIAGFTDLLTEEAAGRLDETARGFLQRIGRSTARMLAVVDELLAYTAATEAALRPEAVDTGRLATDVIAERIGALNRHGGTERRPSIDIGPLPTVIADAAMLRQVFDHLAANALTFVRHDAAARITVSAEQSADGWWRIKVADRGIGVPAEHRRRIFAPFHRAPAAEGFPGSGLGLAICHRIVTLHGGQLGVEPNPGGGSIFWFTVLDATLGQPSGEHSTVSARLP